MPNEVLVNGLFDGRRPLGVQRYASEILRSLGSQTRIIKPKRTLTGLQAQVWEQLVLPRLLGEGSQLWSPANSGPLSVRRQILTLHDLTMLAHPEWYPTGLRLWYRLLLPSLMERVSQVLTVSEYSRRSIMKRFGFTQERVAVVPGAVDLRRFHPTDPYPVRSKYGLSQPYILFVGSIGPRKNLDRLAQAWVRLTDFKELELVIAGPPAGSDPHASSAVSRWRTRYIGYVPEEDLPGLYAGATFFIMPSLYESFGYTVLEAMACGVPVITSNTGGLPEVASGVSMMIDPTSAEGMAEAMRVLLSDEGLRAELSRKGLERACQFSWDRSARQIRDLIETGG